MKNIHFNMHDFHQATSLSSAHNTRYNGGHCFGIESAHFFMLTLARMRNPRWVLLALIALSLHLLLPFAHALSMPSQLDQLLAQNTCRTFGSAANTKGSTSPVSADQPTNLTATTSIPGTTNPESAPAASGLPMCAICAVQASSTLAPPPALTALPSFREHVSSLRLMRFEGSFIADPIYTLPPSQAPPQL
ncbi:hypothetical protein [Chitinibacter tainanensis]|uniref:hypothetical protein n=1 Tax=Chitinibacter tainanensis TaxID=230667 RepID=UPI0004027BCB|nr:hypothetical protein [Chitinibacter tainanensis]